MDNVAHLLIETQQWKMERYGGKLTLTVHKMNIRLDKYLIHPQRK